MCYFLIFTYMNIKVLVMGFFNLKQVPNEPDNYINNLNIQ